MTVSVFIIFSDVDGLVGGSVADTCSAEFLVNYELARRFKTLDCKSCSSSESRFTTVTCVGKVEDCVCTIGEGCAFTGEEGCIFTVCGIGVGVCTEVLKVWESDP